MMVRVAQATIEKATAVALALFGATVAADSLNHEIGWTAAGPGAGYFPFRVGLLIVGASLAVFVRAWGRGPSDTFTTRESFGRMLSVLWPTMALVALMFPLGCYLPALAYLTWMARVHGRWSWGRSAGAAATIVVLLFLVFERWFQVPLAKGPIEDLLGLY